jgi:hypothetical protein
MTKREENLVNSLMPVAENRAMIRLKNEGLTKKSSEPRDGCNMRPSGEPDTYLHNFFTEYFMDEMNKLAVSAGVRSL